MLEFVVGVRLAHWDGGHDVREALNGNEDLQVIEARRDRAVIRTELGLDALQTRFSNVFYVVENGRFRD